MLVITDETEFYSDWVNPTHTVDFTVLRDGRELHHGSLVG